MTTVAPPVKALTITRPRLQALRWRVGLPRLITLVNGLLFLGLAWCLIDLSTPLGPLGFLYADLEAAHPLWSVLKLRTAVIAPLLVFFAMDLCQSMRRLPVSYTSLYSLLGQTALTVITLFYVVQGRLSILALYGVGGVLLLCGVGLVMVIQSQQDTPPRYAARALLYPVLSGLLGFLAISLTLSPDTATLQLIEARYGVLLLGALLVWLAWGSGQLRVNHLPPYEMIKRLGGAILFPFFSLRLWFLGQPVSLVSVLLTVCVAGLMIFCTFVQAEIEREEHKKHVARVKAQYEAIPTQAPATREL